MGVGVAWTREPVAGRGVGVAWAGKPARGVAGAWAWPAAPNFGSASCCGRDPGLGSSGAEGCGPELQDREAPAIGGSGSGIRAGWRTPRQRVLPRAAQIINRPVGTERPACFSIPSPCQEEQQEQRENFVRLTGTRATSLRN